MKRVVLGAILMFIVVGLLSGCRFILGPGPSLELSELEGVWKLQPQHLGDMLEDLDFFYLEIEGDGTVRGWYEQGLWDEYTMSRADDRSYRGEIVRNPRDLGSVGADFNIDFELNGNELSAYYYPDDESWEWKPVFDRADSLPSGEYSHDFEDASYGAVEPHEPDGPKEWTIVERDGDRVLTPTAEDGNSDADIRIAPGENFSVEFQARRLENSQGYSWFAVDFNTYEEETGAEDDMSKWISSEAPNSFSFGNRDGEIDYSSYSFVAPWDTWHTYKITVQDGTEYQFFVDGGLVGQRSVPYGFIQGLKIEGNPDTGEWYFDDLEVTWNTEIEAATVDLSDRTVLTAREGNIVAMRPDGTGHYQLTSSPHWDWMPHWIDDGNKVVFVRSTDPDGEGGQDRSHDIYELDLADMSERVLLESDGQESYIDVSADHSQIVFHSTRDNLKDGDDGNDHLGDVYVMNADGSDVQNLTDTRDFDDLAPSFSPDGTKIAYASGENHPYAAWRI